MQFETSTKLLESRRMNKMSFFLWSLIACAMVSYLCVITTNDAMYWKWFVTHPSILSIWFQSYFVRYWLNRTLHCKRVGVRLQRKTIKFSCKVSEIIGFQERICYEIKWLTNDQFKMLDSLIICSLKQVPNYLKVAEGMKCLFSS